MKNIPFIAFIAFANVLFGQTDWYCANAAYFIEESSTSTIFAEPIPYCIDCPDEEGLPVTCNILLHRPIDELNDSVPLRPHVMWVHGFAPNSDLHDPLSVFAAAKMRDDFAHYGYSASALQYRQDVKGFTIDVCEVPEVEVIKTHYRAIQDVRNAVDLLFRNAEEYGIDTTNFFLFGNSQGGMAVLHAAFVEDEDEWLASQFSQYDSLKTILGPWAPKHHVKGVVSIAASMYNPEFIHPTDSTALFLGHGVCDIVVPIGQGTYFECPIDVVVFGSEKLACRAKDLNIPYHFYAINGLGHAWPEDLNENTTILIRDWLKNQMLCGEPTQKEFIIDEDEETCETVISELPICLSTSIKPVLESSKISFFPNPTTGLLHFQSASLIPSDPIWVSIYNSIGIKVKADFLPDSQSVDLSQFSRGQYWINWSDHKMNHGTQLIILH